MSQVCSRHLHRVTRVGVEHLATANPLEQAGIGLRTAIDRGDLEEAHRLLSAYGSEVEKSFHSMLGDERQIAALANDTKKMFDWARGRVSAVRTQAIADLDALHSTQCYLDPVRTGVKSWEIEG